MFLLKKVFDFRDEANPEGEKPFLDHLEDLRVLVFRVLATLILTTLVCFIFRGELLEIIRKPVVELWDGDQKERLKGLPKEIGLDEWERAKVASVGAVGLNPKEQAHYKRILGAKGEDFDFHVKAAGYYRAVMALPTEQQQKDFVTGLGVSQKMQSQLESLIENEPETEVGAKARMVKMQALKPTETFMLSIKLAFFAGMVVAFPLLMYFILQFILPGLYEKEKKVLFSSLAVGLGLFLLGVVFAYGFVLPRMLAFFHHYSEGMGIGNDWRIGEYITFATQFVLVFGLAFELPVVVMAFVKLGLLTYDTMSRTRSYAIITILVVSMVITPTPDAGTMMMLAIPMYVLYEMCIWLAYFLRDKEELAGAKVELEEDVKSIELLDHDDEYDDHEDEGFDDYDDEMGDYGDEDSSKRDES